MCSETVDKNPSIEQADFETAIYHSGFGRFQTWLVIVSGIIYATCAISSTTLSFVLPSAECDFLLSSSDKGRLSAMPLIGMVIGSYFWGSLADSQGRKWTMIISLLMDGLAALLSSFAQDFRWFLLCKFFNGFGIIGATSIIFSYLGEFVSVSNRDIILCRLEVFWNIGIIVLPGIAWGILPLDWSYTNGNFTYNSWRLFVALCGLPSLISATMLCFLPESPKFLIAHGHHEKARRVLQKIFRYNTGNEHHEYPIKQLQGETFCHLNDSFKKIYIPWHRRLLIQAKNMWLRNKEIFSPPHLRHLFLSCFVDFGLMSSYYTLVMWFPDLFDRFEMYAWINPEDSEAGICDVQNGIAPIDDYELKMEFCTRPIDNQVFLFTIIIGLSCLPSSLSLSYLIDKFGKKILLIVSLTTSGFAVLGLNWVHKTFDTLVLSCLFEALTCTAEAVIFCVVVDLFPTNLRGIALALTVTSGRFGAILGNILFGWLVDLNCVIPVYSFGLLLVSSGIFCFSLPKGGHEVLQ